MVDDDRPAALPRPDPAGPRPGPRRGEDLEAVFSRARANVARRVALLRLATDTLAAGRLDSAGRVAAEQEAHTLAGSAGTFGLDRISELARELEDLLSHRPDDEPHRVRAGHLVRQMSAHLAAAEAGAPAAAGRPDHPGGGPAP